MRATPITIPPKLAIHELSARIARCNAMQADPRMALAEILPPPTEDLAQVIEEMRTEGYTIGEPIRFTPSRMINYTEWHLPVSHGEWHGALAFFIEVQAC